jgi:biopolymer transport protein ExbD
MSLIDQAMRLDIPNHQTSREPDLTGLINIIFLILIFFMIAGTFRPASERNLKLSKIAQAAAAKTPTAHLIARADGTLIYRNQPVSLDELPRAIANDPHLDKKAPFTFAADARLEARKVLQAITRLQQSGINNVSILAERAAQEALP